MRYDTEKDAVRNLQIFLRQLSYTDPDIIPPPIDAVFDTVTRDSLKSFQRKYRMMSVYTFAENTTKEKKSHVCLYIL